ncbi:MerC domain-containing protein [Xanthomonas oryzae]|uniref:MerC domain-containing protein n=1 Tax=Xanthomonas oryzae TaxID=347 RepID=UPI0030FE69D5
MPVALPCPAAAGGHVAATRCLEPGEWVHVVFAMAAVPLSSYALWSTHRRHALPTSVWLLALCGLTGLVLGASGLVGDALETPITVTGSLLLASTHLLNLRLRRRHGGCAR